MRSRPVDRWRRFSQRERWLALALVAPTLLIVVGLTIYPIAYAFWLSLHQVNLIQNRAATPFVGLRLPEP